jgi:hypothetical protein
MRAPSFRLHIITNLTQLKPGDHYKIVGSAADGLPIPAQVFFLEQIFQFEGQPYLEGVIFWQEAFKQYSRSTVMNPAEVNIPDSGWSDVHLERIELLKDGLKDPVRYDEIQQHRKIYKPAVNRSLKRLTDELKKSYGA